MQTLTVFTPAYNRAHTLPRTYESLKQQTCKDFIWMIIDDGSSDGTNSLVESWLSEDNGFEIKYYYKDNGGMHTAHNLAYRMIKTELNVCIDSDDAMPPNAVKDIIEFWRQYGDERFSGIIALDCDMNGQVIGTSWPDGLTHSKPDMLARKYRVTGDKKFIYRTDIISNAPEYPEFEGEKLVPLSYKYSIVGHQYEMLLMKKCVCLVEYQADGSTNTVKKQYLQSPRGFASKYAIEMKYEPSIKMRLKAATQYIAMCRIAHDKLWYKNSPCKVKTVLLYPVGMLVEQYIYRLNKGKN